MSSPAALRCGLFLALCLLTCALVSAEKEVYVKVQSQPQKAIAQTIAPIIRRCFIEVPCPFTSPRPTIVPGLTPTPGPTNTPVTPITPVRTTTPSTATEPGETPTPGTATEPGKTPTPGTATEPGETPPRIILTTPGMTTTPCRITVPCSTTEPGTGTTPRTPTIPDTPTKPDTNITPGTATTPATTTKPGMGTTPRTPTTPGTPTKPDTTTKPGMGTTPRTPTTPGTPTKPDTTTKPGAGTTPDTTTTPGTGTTPSTNTTYGTPTTPSTPTTPASLRCTPVCHPGQRKVVDPLDCYRFYVCKSGQPIGPFVCKDSKVFDKIMEKCVSVKDNFCEPLCSRTEAFCRYTCSDKGTTYRADFYNCSEYYRCDGRNERLICDADAPFFDGDKCQTDNSKCCNCKPYCETEMDIRIDPFHCNRYYQCFKEKESLKIRPNFKDCREGNFDPISRECSRNAPCCTYCTNTDSLKDCVSFFICMRPGLFPACPKRCSPYYYHCKANDIESAGTRKVCDEGRVFNPNHSKCVRKSDCTNPLWKM